MRVITGIARGRRLADLEGKETRPTTDKVKEGIFSAIQFDIEGRSVLDLFAGTGQLGIEALSRGARKAVFVDQRRAAVAVVEENLKRTGLQEMAKVLTRDGLEYLAGCGERFDLIFLDPPYETGLLEKALKRVDEFDILSQYGIIIAEHPENQVLPETWETFRATRSYRYGKIAATVFRRKNEEEQS